MKTWEALGLAALVGVGVLLYVRRSDALGALDAVNPYSRDNLAYSGVNAIGGALVTEPDGPGKNADGSWSLGAWLYDVTHPGWVEEALGTAHDTGGGRWNNPSAYTAPSGQAGAAFGIYPRP